MTPTSLRCRRDARRYRRGATLLEVLTASAISVMVLSSVVAALLSGMQSWARGAGKINAELTSQQTLRTVTSELRQAMAVTVDANGRGITYRLPRLDAGGNYVVPAEWDGVERRIFVTVAGELFLGPVGDTREVADGLILTDPKAANAAYRPFNAGPGSITRRLDVMLVVRQSGAGDQYEVSRVRETVYLRNIPSLTQ